jgi:hypothetical protein
MKPIRSSDASGNGEPATFSPGGCRARGDSRPRRCRQVAASLLPPNERKPGRSRTWAVQKSGKIFLPVASLCADLEKLRGDGSVDISVIDQRTPSEKRAEAAYGDFENRRGE